MFHNRILIFSLHRQAGSEKKGGKRVAGWQGWLAFGERNRKPQPRLFETFCDKNLVLGKLFKSSPKAISPKASLPNSSLDSAVPMLAQLLPP